MTSASTHQRIASYEALQAERARLTTLIAHQKELIRQDIEELKEEIATKFYPVAEAADFVKKISTPETRNNSLLQVGSSVLIEVLVRKIFARSNFFVQLLVPNLIKNYSTHLLFNLLRNLHLRRQNGHHSNGIQQSNGYQH
jgi:hypothetical protein